MTFVTLNSNRITTNRRPKLTFKVSSLSTETAGYALEFVPNNRKKFLLAEANCLASNSLSGGKGGKGMTMRLCARTSEER